MNLACTKCKKLNKEYGMMKGERVNCLGGCGPDRANIMLVGEAPGMEEAIRKENFVGRAGRFLNKQIFSEAGVDRDKIRLENAVRCRPYKNRTPTDGEAKNCREYLVEAIKKSKPKVIIASGGTAWKSLTNLSLSSVLKWQGKEVWSREFNCWIVPTAHPSYLMRNRSEFEIYNTVDYVELAMSLVKEKKPDIPEMRWVLVDSDKKNEEIIAKLKKAKKYAVDTETTGDSGDKGSGKGGSKARSMSHFLRDDIIGVSFSVKLDEGYFVPWEYIEKREKDYKQILSDPKKLKILHNCPFDNKFFKSKGYEVAEPMFDTLLAHHLTDENFEYLHGLKPLTWRYTYYGGYDQELEAYKKKKKIKNYGDIPLEMLAEYACYDSAVAFELEELFREKMEEDGVLDVFDQIVMPSRTVFTEMEYKGVKVDIRYLKKIQKKLGDDLELIGGRIKRVASKYGMKDFNIESNPQMQILLFNKLGMPPVKLTKTGYSTDKDVLEELAGRHKVIDLIIAFRKLAKYKSTYVDAMLRDNIDGIIHTRYGNHSTVTGRAGSSQPCLQNIPVDKDVKTVFIARPEMILLDADYSQAELRVLAFYSQDEFMLQVYEDDGDIHTMIGAEYYGITPEEFDKDKLRRKRIKTINFGIAYMMGYKALARQTGMPEEVAQEFLYKYFKKFPKLKKYQKDTIKLARKQGYITNFFGRRRRLPNLDHDDAFFRYSAEREAANMRIQGTVADMTQTSLRRIRDAFSKYNIRNDFCYPLLQVHDSIVCEVYKKHERTARKIIVEEMEKPFEGFPIRMKADIEVVRKWGENNPSLGFMFRDVRKEVLK